MTKNASICFRIDLFSLYVLFSHFRPCDATRGNSFFQMSSYERANVCITIEKNKRKIPMRASRGLKWKNKKFMYKLKRSITPLITCHLMQIYHYCKNKFWSIFPLSKNFVKVDPDFFFFNHYFLLDSLHSLSKYI